MRISTTPLMNLTIGLGLIAAGLTLQACRGGSEELSKLQESNSEILARLEKLEKKVEQASARPAPPPRRGPDPDKAHDLAVGKSPIRGPEDAAVTIVEFSDYQCPFCARSEPLIKDALKTYPEQVRFVYKHFPLTSIHPNALGAAQAAAAAQQQGKFWEMHDLLFANQRALQPDQLKKYAEQLGLDMAKFEADMQSPEIKKMVQEDTQLAMKVGVRGTPTIFVNGKLLRNRSLAGFKQMIDPILKEKSTG